MSVRGAPTKVASLPTNQSLTMESSSGLDSYPTEPANNTRDTGLTESQKIATTPTLHYDSTIVNIHSSIIVKNDRWSHQSSGGMNGLSLDTTGDVATNPEADYITNPNLSLTTATPTMAMAKSSTPLPMTTTPSILPLKRSDDSDGRFITGLSLNTDAIVHDVAAAVIAIGNNTSADKITTNSGHGSGMSSSKAVATIMNNNGSGSRSGNNSPILSARGSLLASNISGGSRRKLGVAGANSTCLRAGRSITLPSTDIGAAAAADNAFVAPIWTVSVSRMEAPDQTWSGTQQIAEVELAAIALNSHGQFVSLCYYGNPDCLDGALLKAPDTK
jgi:hypothetical protein